MTFTEGFGNLENVDEYSYEILTLERFLELIIGILLKFQIDFFEVIMQFLRYFCDYDILKYLMFPETCFKMNKIV